MSMPNDLALGPVDSGRLRVFSGSSNPALAKDIAMSLGMPLGGITIKRFADGEVYVQLEVSIRHIRLTQALLMGHQYCVSTRAHE